MPPTVRLLVLAVLLSASQAYARPVDHAAADPVQRAQPADPATAPAAAQPKPKPVRNPAFYSEEVTVRSQGAGERRGATMRALGLVVVRLTGNPQAASNPVIRRGGANIDAMTTSSTFRQDTDMVNGVPVYKTVLAVSFDPERVDALIAGAGLKFWTSERPKPILWLAIDDGRGPRLVTGQQTNVVKPLAMRGLQRGMRFLLPAGTGPEQAAVKSILALDGVALEPLTRRYRNDAQLVGKVYRQGPGWAADWLLSQAGVELARWSFADLDPRKVIASGVDDGANAIAKRDGVYLDTGVAGLYTIEVEGVNSQADYIRLMSYLQTVPVVRKVSALEATPATLRLQLDLSVGMKGFRTMVGTGGTLRALSESDLPSPGGATGAARFGLQ
jgi:hypothetical protein